MTSPAAGASLGDGRSWPRIVGYVLGVALVVAAVAAVMRRREALEPAIDQLLAASLPSLAVAAALPIASVALTALTFWILTRRHGRVGAGEMLALINAAWLLNYLPLWPGMFGRLTYHRTVNGIALRDSVTATIWANVLALIAAAGLLLLLVVASAIAGVEQWLLVTITAAPIPLLGLMGLWAYRKPPAPDPHFWRLPTALAVRWAELLVWAGRYSVCFALIGVPIGFGAALALAAITGLSSLLPLTGNALGVREWVVGLAAPLLPLGLTMQTSLGTHTGLTADLTNRAIEVALAVPLGVVASLWLTRRIRMSRREVRASSAA